MKALAISTLILMTATVLGQTHKHDHSEHKASAESTLSQSDLKVLKIVLKKNDELYNTLLKNDQKEAETSANLMSNVLKAAKSDAFKILRERSASLKRISKSNSKDQNLRAYEDFIPSLVELVRKYRPDSNYQIYYCPMVKKNWIQDQRTNSTVKNVFAQDMLECGGKEG